MKNIFLILVFATIATALSFGQKISSDKVPSSVLKAFKAKFANASDIKWNIEKSKDYEAEFKFSDIEYSANFRQDGTWLETETELKVSQLPQTVSQAISKDFAGFKIDEASKNETSDNKTFYEVEVSKDKEKYELKISTTGVILNKKVEKEDND